MPCGGWPARRLRAGADRARRGGVALPQQARVLVRRARRRARAGFHRRGSWSGRGRRRRLPARLDGQQRGPEPRCANGPGGRGSPRTTVGRRTACCETWSSARAGARARSRPDWSPRRRPSPGRRSIYTPSSRGRAAAPAGQPECSGEEHLEERARGLRFRVSPTAFLQTNTEMAERLYAVVAEYAGPPGASASSTCTAGSGRSALALAPRRERSGASRAWRRRSPTRRQRSAQPDRERPFHLRRRAARRAAPARAGGRPDVVVVDPPRAGLSKKVVRRVIECERATDRLRLVQPDHAGPQRRPAVGGRL